MKRDCEAEEDRWQVLEPRAATIPGALRATEQALQAMTDTRRFEDLAVACLQGIEPLLRPTGGSGDRQRDGVAGPLRAAGDEVVLAASLQQAWASKLSTDLHGISGYEPLPKLVIAATNRRTKPSKRHEVECDAQQQYGFRLRIFDQRMLALRLLRPELLHIREELLNLPAPTPAVAVDAECYRRSLASTASKVDALHGREEELGELLSVIEHHNVVALLGAGGVGKTRLVLAAADQLVDRRTLFLDDRARLDAATLPAEVAGADPLVLVLDNAHRRSDLRELIGLVCRRVGVTTIVLVARDGFQSQLRDAIDGSSLGPLRSDATVTLSRMSDLAIAEMVRAAAPRLQYSEAVETIVTLAEGNPLIALMAHGVAVSGGALEELGRDEILAEHARSLVRSLHQGSTSFDEHELSELLAVIAALSWADRGEVAVLTQISALLGVSPQKVRRMLLDIADSGLLSQTGERFAITPDLLSGHLLWASFFAAQPSISLTYSELWAAFAPAACTACARHSGASLLTESRQDTPAQPRSRKH